MRWLNAAPAIEVTAMPGVTLPFYSTDGSACRDIMCFCPGGVVKLAPGEITIVHTGMKMAISKGYRLSILPKSGLAAMGITIVNAPGTIDSDYRDEVKLIMINHGKHAYHLRHGDKAAQVLLERCDKFYFKHVQTLKSPKALIPRTGGLGSTGR